MVRWAMLHVRHVRLAPARVVGDQQNVKWPGALRQRRGHVNTPLSQRRCRPSHASAPLAPAPIVGVRLASFRGAGGGFTLLEIMVVLVIGGLLIGLVVSHGPVRSARLETDGAARQLAGTFRLARAEAIANDRPVQVTIDPVGRRVWIDRQPASPLPPLVAVAVHNQAGGRAVSGFLFTPDGGASGGSVELSSPGHQVRLTVDWLTGRVKIGP
jgi:general secretion pathway protein H